MSGIFLKIQGRELQELLEEIETVRELSVNFEFLSQIQICKCMSPGSALRFKKNTLDGCLHVKFKVGIYKSC